MEEPQQTWSWTSNEMIAVYIAVGALAVGLISWLLMRKTMRTRVGMERQLREDPDMNDWLVLFGWTPKVLYVPTMLAALLAAALMFLQQTEWRIFSSINPRFIGGVWFAIFFVNFLIEEYNINIKILVATGAVLAFLFLWLHLLGWVVPFLKLFRHMGFSISATGYLLIAVIGFVTVFFSWFRGLFYYVTFTPNYLNLQEGPAEAGEQLGREDFNTKVDTSDFLERVLGFGRISITFKDRPRPPLTVLVWRVERKAQMLEKVRAKFAIDHPQTRPYMEPHRSEPAPPPDHGQDTPDTTEPDGA